MQFDDVCQRGTYSPGGILMCFNNRGLMTWENCWEWELWNNMILRHMCKWEPKAFPAFPGRNVRGWLEIEQQAYVTPTVEKEWSEACFELEFLFLECLIVLNTGLRHYRRGWNEPKHVWKFMWLSYGMSQCIAFTHEAAWGKAMGLCVALINLSSKTAFYWLSHGYFFIVKIPML